MTHPMRPHGSRTERTHIHMASNHAGSGRMVSHASNMGVQSRAHTLLPRVKWMRGGVPLTDHVHTVTAAMCMLHAA
jgi:hypothetical protein